MNGIGFDFHDLHNSASQSYSNFSQVAQNAIDKAFLITDIRRQYQGSEIITLRPDNGFNADRKLLEPKVYVDFIVQV